MTVIRCDCLKKDVTDPGPAEGRVLGKVTNRHGKPLPGVIVTTKPDGYTTMCLSDGTFELSDLNPGTEYQLNFHLVDYRDTAVDLAELGMDETRELDEAMKLVFRYGTIEGGVYKDDAATIPASRAGIEVEGQYIVGQAMTDGSFKIPKIEPPSGVRKVRLVAALQGFGFGYTDVEVHADSELAGVPIILDREGGTITGRVVDVAGDAVEDVIVRAVGGLIVDTTDADGRYVLSNIPTIGEITLEFVTPGDVTFQANGIQAMESMIVTIPAVVAPAVAPAVTAGITMTPMLITVAAKDSAVTLTVAASYASTVHVDRFFWDFDGDAGYDDSSAANVITISSSRFDWGTSETSRTVYVKAVTVTGDSTEPLALTVKYEPRSALVAAALLTGVVVNNESKPLSGVTVTVNLPGLSQVTGANGVFAFRTDSLANRPDTVVISKSGFTTKQLIIKSYTLNMGNIMLLADGGGGSVLVGRVLNEADEPLPGALATIKGVNLRATTDLQGLFAIPTDDLSSGTVNDTLAVTKADYQTLTVRITSYDDDAGDLVLKADTLAQEPPDRPGL